MAQRQNSLIKVATSGPLLKRGLEDTGIFSMAAWSPETIGKDSANWVSRAEVLCVQPPNQTEISASTHHTTPIKQ